MWEVVVCVADISRIVYDHCFQECPPTLVLVCPFCYFLLICRTPYLSSIKMKPIIIIICTPGACICKQLVDYVVNIYCLHLIRVSYTLWNYFYWLLPILVVSTKCIDPWVHEFVVSTKCIDPWVHEFVVSNITGNSQWENCISLDFNVHGLSGPRNPRKLEPHD